MAAPVSPLPQSHFNTSSFKVTASTRFPVKDGEGLDRNVSAQTGRRFPACRAGAHLLPAG